ncbi:uncharacterized protein PAC_17853 [Phialocephala subalpina]|uniref:BTB domain-containing protein n=1 Tax=Phialocephala subalpina TaxID=576137 RepID=A0A1L7XSC7_9HELO|nr:uncharacterized protein PAC_17853 [Phialocephala subalpina]
MAKLSATVKANMSNTNIVKSISEAPFQDFASSRILPLYNGPHVSIRIGSTSPDEFKVPKALLCKQSPYFAATFEGNFKEGRDHSTTLEEVDGVVTTRSFQMLLQWLYIGRVVFGELSSSEAITAILEFVRLADMCGVNGMESGMAKHITRLILTDDIVLAFRHGDAQTWCFKPQHVTSAASLPKGHPVRDTLAAAAVKGYFQFHDSRFVDKAEEYPDFSVDVLIAMKATIRSLTCRKSSATFKDPLSGDSFSLA